MKNCDICTRQLTRDNGTAPIWDSIWRTDHWDLVHAFNSSLLGWLVLVTRRHIEALDELTAEEAQNLGRLLRDVSITLKAEVGCQKTYVMQFAEQKGYGHVHFHIVPRMVDIPQENMGKNAFNFLVANDDDDRVSDEEMNALAQRIRTRLEADRA
jgi:diadenosine tetraphosphate (Ap4A) HIT family hydrolase